MFFVEITTDSRQMYTDAMRLCHLVSSPLFSIQSSNVYKYNRWVHQQLKHHTPRHRFGTVNSKQTARAIGIGSRSVFLLCLPQFRRSCALARACAQRTPSYLYIQHILSSKLQKNHDDIDTFERMWCNAGCRRTKAAKPKPRSE